MQLLMNKFSVDNNAQLKYASRWHFLGDKTFPWQEHASKYLCVSYCLCGTI